MGTPVHHSTETLAFWRHPICDFPWEHDEQFMHRLLYQEQDWCSIWGWRPGPIKSRCNENFIRKNYWYCLGEASEWLQTENTNIGKMFNFVWVVLLPLKKTMFFPDVFFLDHRNLMEATSWLTVHRPLQFLLMKKAFREILSCWIARTFKDLDTAQRISVRATYSIVWSTSSIYENRDAQFILWEATLIFKFRQTAFPGRRNSYFFISQLNCVDLPLPVLSTKVGTKQ